MTNGAAPVSGTSASSFWSRKLQEDKSASHGALTNGVSKSNGVSSNGNPPNGITFTNSTTAPKNTLFHKTTSNTLAQVKTASSPAIQPPRNSMVFKRKQSATVFANSNTDEKIDFPPNAKRGDIQQLEDEVAAKNDCIKALEVKAHAMDIHVQQLQTDTQFTIQQLVTLVDEKDHHIAVLETKIEQMSQLVQQLEKMVKALEEEASVSVGQQPKPEVAPQVSTQTQKSQTQSATKGVMQEESQPQELESTLADTPTATKTVLTRTPAPRDSNEPLFSTPETVKTGPPVPKAPLIVFPQKNMKKAPTPAPKPTTSAAISAPEATENTAKGAWAGTGHLPDIRNLSRDQREELGRGPKVTITVGGVSTPVMPKKMLMQVSEAANDYFSKNPNAKVMPFPRGRMVGGAVCEFAKWINDICTASKEFSVKIRFSNVTKDADTQNLAIMQAARVLGMSTYVRHFTRHYCDEIRTVLLPLDTIASIEQFTTTDDPVYECLVNNMAHHRSKRNVPDQQQLEKFLVAHPRLANDLEKAIAKIQEKREAGRNRGKGGESAR